MSANADIIARLYRALAAHDVPQILQMLSPDVGVRQSPQLPRGGVFHGHPDDLAFLDGVVRHLDSSVRIERLLDAGEQVAVIGRTSGTLRESGRAFDEALMHLYDLEGSLITRGQICIDTAEMLRVLGEGEGPADPSGTPAG